MLGAAADDIHRPFVNESGTLRWGTARDEHFVGYRFRPFGAGGPTI